MHVMKWSVIALAVAAGTSQLALASAQSDSQGFVEDSSLNILNRNLYFHRDFRDGAGQSKREEWAHGLIGTFESGFTPGAVGFGFDAFGLVGLKLDSSPDRAGTGLLPGGFGDRAPDDYSQAGAAVKARISNTVLKYGDQFVAVPVFDTGDSRLLPQSATGFLLTSSEMEGLELNAGYFTAMSAQNQSGRDSYDDGILKSIVFAGGTFAFNDDLSASLYYSDLEDAFKKYYGNLNASLPINDKQALNFDFNIYNTDYDNDDSNTIWSLAGGYKIDAHGFTLAYQQSSGDAGYTYDVGDGGDTVYLANSIQLMDFELEDEKSVQARYDLNLGAYGVPGLSFMARYVRGWDFQTANGDDSSRWERNMEVKYVVQAGAAKDLSLRVRQATYRANSDVPGYGRDIDEVRVIAEYPLSIL